MIKLDGNYHIFSADDIILIRREAGNRASLCYFFRALNDDNYRKANLERDRDFSKVSNSVSEQDEKLKEDVSFLEHCREKYWKYNQEDRTYITPFSHETPNLITK